MTCFYCKGTMTDSTTAHFAELDNCCVIIGAGDRSYKLRALLSDVQMLFMNASELICKALPVYVFCSLLSLFWKNGM